MVDTTRIMVREFPPRRRGVLVPIHHKGATLAGLSMYTASKHHIVALQKAAYSITRMFGPKVLPGRTFDWAPPLDADTWKSLLRTWREVLGPFDSFAVYQRRQSARVGLTLVVAHRSEPVAVIKVRDTNDGLSLEQGLLRAVGAATPQTFAVPRAMGEGAMGNVMWSAQSAVFRRPHSAVRNVPTGFWEDLNSVLAAIEVELPLSPLPVGPDLDARSTLHPSHGDLTPWNLRRDHTGRVWLFDWEDACLAPVAADRAYFHGSLNAITRSPVPVDLPTGAIEYAARLFASRVAGHSEDAVIARRVAAAFRGALDH